MNEQEYRAYKALNYSLLASFAESPDVALMPVKSKEYFETGKAFERLLEDTVKGTKHFPERFFVTEITGKMPDDLPTWVKDGTLEDNIVYNKDGVTKNKRQETRHAYIDVCLKNPGRLPISVSLYNMLKIMVKNTLNCEFMGLPMRLILSDAEFQVPFIWEDQGIEKKALYDCVAEVVIDGEPVKLFIDLKSTAQIDRFRYMVSSRYKWQDAHYLQGAMYMDTPIYEKMVFLACGKSEPYLAKCFTIADESRDKIKEAYTQLCVDCQDWIDNGKPAKGWLEEEELRIFV